MSLKARIERLEIRKQKENPLGTCTCACVRGLPARLVALLDEDFDGIPIPPDTPDYDPKCPRHGEGSDWQRTLQIAYGEEPQEPALLPS